MNKDKEIIQPEQAPYVGEHACRLNSPTKYTSFARKNCYMKHNSKCVDVIFGIKAGKSEIQAIRMPTENWSEMAAKTYCKELKGEFDAAAD